jgi:sterol 3beta-glucosyltransferase
MIIVILAPGSRGDVEPYIALGAGLIKAGHTVRLVTHQDFASLVQPYGFEFFPVDVSVQEIAQSHEMRQLLGGGNILAVMSQMAKEAKIGALRLTEIGLSACRDADLLLAGIGGIFTALDLAEKLSIPLLPAYYIPFTPTSAYPSFLLPRLPAFLARSTSRFSYRAAQEMMWQTFRPADVLGMASAPILNRFGAGIIRRSPVIYGFSPVVIPPPPDWGADIHITGYWFLDPPDEYAPPAALEEFIQAGPPPVYIGFGSMSSRNPQETTRLILNALSMVKQRAVLHAGWGGLSQADLPESVLDVASVPFAWLFPRMAAVIHHGGAGTTAAGLRAGIPSVLVPFFGDQPFWAQRVVDLGAGPAPIPRRKLTAERLAHAIQQSVEDQEMRRRAAELGVRIRTEDGVGQSVEVVQEMLQ